MFSLRRNRVEFTFCCVVLLTVSCIQNVNLDRKKLGVDKLKENEALNPFKPSAPYFCPEKAEYSADIQFCVRSGMALGPFTKKMIALCKAEVPVGVNCDDFSWPVKLAGHLRGSDFCPAGSSQLENGFCAEDKEVYGPFVFERVEVCKELKGGPACESNRWSIFFAESTRAVPNPMVEIPAANEEAFERYIAPTVYEILEKDKGKGYTLSASGQHARDLFYNGTKIFSVNTGRSHCVGMTFQTLIMAMNRYYSETKDGRVWNLPANAMSWEPFKDCWYVNSPPGMGFSCHGARDAIVHFGLGIAIKNFSDLKIGDFVNYDRTSGYGHSVVFMKFLFAGGKTSFVYGTDAVGFQYFSSQGSTDGAGFRDAYFSGNSCAAAATNDCGILKNSLVMGRVLHPSKFVRQNALFSSSLFSDSVPTSVLVPARYLFGNQ